MYLYLKLFQVAVFSVYLFEDCEHKVLAIDIVVLVLRRIHVYFDLCSGACCSSTFYLGVLFKYATFL